MIATGAQREHSPDIIDAETFFKIEKGTSAHRIDEICQKIKIIKSNFSANMWLSR